MKIVIPTNDSSVSKYFGCSPAYTIIDIQNGNLVDKEVIRNPEDHPGYLPQFFSDKKVDCIVTNDKGTTALDFLFKQYDIEILTNISGRIDEVIQQLLKK